MTIQEFNAKETAIKIQYELAIKALHDEWVQSNAAYKVGDFIANVTGIIKVERISCENFRGEMIIRYYGYRYKQVKGVLSRTKDNKISELTYNLRKIK